MASLNDMLGNDSFNHGLIMAAIKRLDHQPGVTEWERGFIDSMVDLRSVAEAVGNKVELTLRQYNMLMTIRDKYDTL